MCPESNLLELEMFCLKHLRFDKTLGNPVFLIFEGSTHQTPDVFTLALCKWVAKSGALLFLSAFSVAESINSDTEKNTT